MEFEIGAIKLKDGFFIGDLYSGRDYEFVALNKITRIVNTAPSQLPNQFAQDGEILYLDLDWQDSDLETFFVDRNQVQQLASFLNSALELGESILIHSVKCQNRAIVACACYLIYQYQFHQIGQYRFRWSAETSIEFIYSRKKIPRMRPAIEKCIYEYEKIEKPYTLLKTIAWNADLIKKCELNSEELVLAHTFYNSNLPVDKTVIVKEHNPRLQWSDKVSIGQRMSKNRLVSSVIPAFEQLTFTKQILSDVKKFKGILKGCLKSTEIKEETKEPTSQKDVKILKPNLQIQNERRSSAKKLTLELDMKRYDESDFEQQFQNLNRRNTIDPSVLQSRLKKNQNLFNLYGISPTNKRPPSREKKNQSLTNFYRNSNSQKTFTTSTKFNYLNYRSQKNLKSNPKQVKTRLVATGTKAGSIKTFIEGLMKRDA